MPTIQEELALVAKKVPDFAPPVIAAIEAGEIGGSGYDICFYGHICPDDHRRAIALAEYICEELHCDMTPIENLLLGCFSYTHETHQGLATLHEALQPYLQQEELV